MFSPQVAFRYNLNRAGFEAMDPPLQTADGTHKRICLLLSIKCQVELRVQISGSGRTMQPLGRPLNCTRPIITRPSHKIPQKQAWPELPNLTRARGLVQAYRLFSSPAFTTHTHTPWLQYWC